MAPFHTKVLRSTRIALEVSAHPVVLDSDTPSPSCPTCHDLLDLHQPDEGRPAQLLAVCLSCSKWYLWLDEEDEGMGLVLIELPTPATIREHLAAPAERPDLGQSPSAVRGR